MAKRSTAADPLPLAATQMSAASSGDAGSRGELTMADKVGVKVATRAALDIDSVVRFKTTMGSLLGGATPIGGVYPSVTVDMSDKAPIVDVVIAVRWPCPLTSVCQAVRSNVAAELIRLTGVRPSRVNVTVGQIVSPEQVVQKKKGFVELPAPAPASDEHTTDESSAATSPAAQQSAPRHAADADATDELRPVGSADAATHYMAKEDIR